jgi:hypothetical protein
MITSAVVFLPAVAALLIGCTSNSRATTTTHQTAACVRVTIGTSSRCLIAGKPCNPRYEKLYERHGFRCKPNTDGNYRLWQPITVGPTKPGQPKP